MGFFFILSGELLGYNCTSVEWANYPPLSTSVVAYTASPGVLASAAGGGETQQRPKISGEG